MTIADLVRADAVAFPLHAADRIGAVRELSSALAGLYELDAGDIQARLLERDQLGKTAVGNEVAMPHAKMDLARMVEVPGLSERSVDSGAPDGLPIWIFIALISPLPGREHLTALAAARRAQSDGLLRKGLLEATSTAEPYRRLLRATRDARFPGR